MAGAGGRNGCGCADLAHRRRHRASNRLWRATRTLPYCRDGSPRRRGSSCSAPTIPIRLRANAQAKEDIAQGATGLALVFEGAPNAFGYGLPATPEALETVLEDIPLNRTHLRIDVHPASRAMADWLVALLARKAADPSKLSLSFGIDPAAIFAGTGRLSMSIEALQASMPQSLAHFFAVGIPGVLLEADGRVFHNAGATEAQELGAMIAARRCPSAAFRGGPPGARPCASAYRLCAQRRSGPVPVDGQDQGAAQTLGKGPGGLLRPSLARDDPRRDVVPNDDPQGSRRQTSCAQPSPAFPPLSAAPTPFRSFPIQSPTDCPKVLRGVSPATRSC